MRHEKKGQQVFSMEELRISMFKKFIPSIEKLHAKLDLVNLKMGGKQEADKHIDRFEELVET